MTTEIFASAAVPGLAGALAHLRVHQTGWIRVNFQPVDGRGLSVDVRPERLRGRETVAGYAELAVFRWLAAVRHLGLLPLALDARLPARALAAGTDAPFLRREDVGELVDRLRRRVAAAAGGGAPFPDVLIRVDRGRHQVRVAGADRRVLAVRDALAAEVMSWLAEHGPWWDGCGAFAVKLEPSRA